MGPHQVSKRTIMSIKTGRMVTTLMKIAFSRTSMKKMSKFSMMRIRKSFQRTVKRKFEKNSRKIQMVSRIQTKKISSKTTLMVTSLLRNQTVKVVFQKSQTKANISRTSLSIKNELSSRKTLRCNPDKNAQTLFKF